MAKKKYRLCAFWHGDVSRSFRAFLERFCMAHPKKKTNIAARTVAVADIQYTGADPFAPVYLSKRLSQAFKDLTAKQQILLECCELQRTRSFNPDERQAGGGNR